MNVNESESVNADEKSGSEQETAPVQGADKPTEKGDNWIPKTRLDQEIAKRKEAERMIQEIAKDYADAVPEQFRDCIPDLPPTAKISWIKQAIDKNLFGGNSKHESGPDSKRPTSKPAVDLSKASTMGLLEAGYKKNLK